MADIRQAISERLRELGWTRYRLAKELHPRLSRQSVYKYLAGDNDTTADKAQAMLAILGLSIVPGSAGRIVESPCGKPAKGKKPAKNKGNRRRRGGD